MSKKKEKEPLFMQLARIGMADNATKADMARFAQLRPLPLGSAEFPNFDAVAQDMVHVLQA